MKDDVTFGVDDVNNNDDDDENCESNDIWNINVSYCNDDHLEHEQCSSTSIQITNDDVNTINLVNDTQLCLTGNNHNNSYTSKKPLWWKRQSNRSKLSSRQRMAIQIVQQEFKLQLTIPTRKKDIPNPTLGSVNNTNENENIVDEEQFIRQTQCPQLQWNRIFPSFHQETQSANSRVQDEIWFEIGFGLGDNLLCLVERNSNAIHDDTVSVDDFSNISTFDNPRCSARYRRYYVGAEMHKGGIGTICTRIQSAIQHNEYWNEYTLHTSTCTTTAENLNHENNTSTERTTMLLYDNLRIYMGDGIKLLPYIPDHTVSAILITFPDPFMGSNQQSFRILQLNVLDEIRRVLVKPTRNTSYVATTTTTTNLSQTVRGGRLYLATDHSGYHDWSHEQIAIYNENLMKESDISNETTPDTIVTAENTVISSSFVLIHPTPDRCTWLPVVSKYEQLGIDAGRTTHLSCWEIQ